MEARMNNPAVILPEAMQALQRLAAVTRNGGVPRSTLELTHLRVSQINGCGLCIDMGKRSAQKAGETAARLDAVAAWRDAPCFSASERAALALAEAVTRLGDTDPVPDETWDEAARHYNEHELAALILDIATTNVWNRLNISVRQIGGTWTG